MELIILTGLQGSGKSTFYRSRFSATHVLVSKDRMPNRPKRAVRQRQLIGEALQAGRSVVVDNTNPTSSEREELIRLGRKYGAVIIGYYFASEVRKCAERNQQRTGKERVPDVAIFVTAKKLEHPSLREGFDRLYDVTLSDGDFEVTPRRELPEHGGD
jgi:predicted kinase